MAVEQFGQAIKRGKRVSADILRFTQPAEPQRQAIDIAAWLRNVDLEARSLLPVNCDVNVFGTDEAMCIDGDPAQLQQVFTNLILNARDAMPRGGTLTISATRAGVRQPFGVVAMPERFIHISVSDTGKNGGGLGLSLTHQVVTRHGGELFVESVPGVGTTFHLFLPIADAVDEAACARRAEEPDTVTVVGRRLLLVEDDALVVLGMRTLLQLDGVDVHIATTGADAIRSVHRHSFDVVVLDVALPDMDGANVYNAIAAVDPDLPVIFSTGHGDRGRLEPLTSRPNVRFLLKPYEGSMLLDTMRDLLNSVARK